jgi:hypothetical protein
MPRLASIPRYLEQRILHRWINGESPQQILDWINQSNATRRKPVDTSRSSVERCIARMSQGESVLSGAAACRRLRCLAPTLVEKYETVTAAYEKSITDAALLDGSAEAKMRHQEQARALTRLDMSLSRQLRLAGCTGLAADRLLQKAEALEAAHVEELRAIKDGLRAKYAGLIAEAAAQNPAMRRESVEDLVLGDDFADRHADHIRMDREDEPPREPEISGPDSDAAQDTERVARPSGPCLDATAGAAVPHLIVPSQTAGTAVPQLNAAGEETAGSVVEQVSQTGDGMVGTAALQIEDVGAAESVADAGGSFTVSSEECAAEQGELIRGTSRIGQGPPGRKSQRETSSRRPHRPRSARH